MLKLRKELHWLSPKQPETDKTLISLLPDYRQVSILSFPVHDRGSLGRIAGGLRSGSERGKMARQETEQRGSKEGRMLRRREPSY